MSSGTPADGQLLRTQLTVRGGSRVAGQRLGVTDVDQAQDHLQGIDEPGTGLFAALDAEAQDAGGLAARDLLAHHVIRAVGQTRVADPLHLRMLLQMFGHALRILAMPLHAQSQRFEALHDQEGIQRRDGRTHVAQRHDAAAADIGRRSECLGVDHAVIGRIGLVEHRETLGVGRPVELAGIDNGTADAGAVAADVLGQ